MISHVLLDLHVYVFPKSEFGLAQGLSAWITEGLGVVDFMLVYHVVSCIALFRI